MIKMVYVRGVNEKGLTPARAIIVRLSSTLLPAMYTIIRIFRQNIVTLSSANGYVISLAIGRQSKR